ncbi:MAG: YlzJ-like family protein [Bacillota bacterium]
MILYTPLPMELVLQGLESEPVPKLKETTVGGVPVIVEETGPGRGRLVRLLSTDPYAYLKPDLTPGTEVIFDFGKDGI